MKRLPYPQGYDAARNNAIAAEIGMNSVARFCAFCLVVLAGCSNDEHEPAVAAVKLATAPYQPAALAIQCGTLIDGIS
ncbi:MAG: hypothetical protein ACJ8MH_18695, partial [Povalibacter sp.]